MGFEVSKPSLASDCGFVEGGSPGKAEQQEMLWGASAVGAECVLAWVPDQGFCGQTANSLDIPN